MSTTVMEHQTPLLDHRFDRKIGGSAGIGTFGDSIDRPDEMPTRSECDHVVRNKKQFLEHIGTDGVSIYIDDDIDLTGEYNIRLGSGITLVGGYCDPNRLENGGRGPVINQDYYNPPRYGQEVARTLISKWGEAPTLYGVAFEGPNRNFFDPRERKKSDEWDSDNEKDWYATALWCYDEKGELEVYGCEFAGWTMAGVEIGSRGHLTRGIFERCSFHDNFMMTLGYGVEQYNGFAKFDLCFFDTCRHGISGFGYPSESWEIHRSVIGPGPWCGHALDMHKLDNNLHNGDLTAGNRILIKNCTIMCTDDIRGFKQEGFALRGIPESYARIENTHFFHDRKPKGINVQGEAYRQEDVPSWTKFYVKNNLFGPNVWKEGIGAPVEVKSEPPKTTMKELEVRGKGDSGRYDIEIRGGTVKPSEDIESNDAINQLKNNITEVSGGIVGASDTFYLEDGAIPIAASWDARVSIHFDGEDITAQLLGVEMNDSIEEIESDLDSMEARLTKITSSLREAFTGL